MTSVRPIRFADQDTLSLRQLDELNGLRKGTSFRLFKACEAQLVEGSDFFYLPAARHEALIDSLKASEQIYGTTVHLVLLTRHGYERMRDLSARTVPNGA